MIAFDERNDVIACDVLVLGAGPGGIACSVRASARGARVVVVDRAAEPGGQIWRHRAGTQMHGAARRWLDRFASSDVVFIGTTSVVDVSRGDDGLEVVADSSGRPLRIHAASIVVAAGARELFIPFEGWTLPGVMGIGGAQALLKSGGSFRGKRVVIAGSGPLMLPVAASMRDAGANVVLMAEQASGWRVARFGAGLLGAPRTLLQAMTYRVRLAGIGYSTSTWVSCAHGDDALESVTVTNGRRTWRLETDILCTGYGLVPNVEIAQLLGCELRDGAIVVNADQRTSVPGVFAAGECTGVGGADLALVEGELAGYAATDGDAPRVLRTSGSAHKLAAARMRRAFAPRAELRGITTATTVVCRCEDVRYGALRGLASSRQGKLYTRAGMGPCQGRTCMASLEFLMGWKPDSVRPPLEATLLRNLLQEGATPAPLADHLNQRAEEAIR